MAGCHDNDDVKLKDIGHPMERVIMPVGICWKPSRARSQSVDRPG